MAQTAPDLISIDDYLTGEQVSKLRHEYVNGHVYAMVGASDAHGLIAGSIFAALRSHLRGSPCQVFIADMKVRIETTTEDRFYYPDVLVSCTTTDRERFFRRSPCLIVAVLSAATERLDRGGKFQAFRQLDGLRDYVLVSQEKSLIEVFSRDTDWRPEYYGDGDSIPLRSLNIDLAVAVVYEDLEQFRMLFAEAPEYRLVSTLFLRVLALVYFAAFASVLPQISGLVGPEGILPFTEELAYLEGEIGIERYWAMPTLFWLGAGDWALRGAALAGCLFSLLLLLNRYRFASPESRKQSGAWWEREDLGPFIPLGWFERPASASETIR